jgi:hypothetical protein
MSKYKAVRTEVDGIKFASKLEAKRYGELRLLERAGEIKFLALQVKFPIMINDEKICTYIADFKYFVPVEGGQKIVIEDAKGCLTPMYRLKKKLVKVLYGIDIVEIRK